MLDLALTLIVYAALALAYFGWGVAAARVLRVTSDAATLTWLGWAVALLMFQVVHFVVPLNGVVTVPVFLMGIAFAMTGVRAAAGRPYVVMVVVAAVFVALRSMPVPAIYDSGLYHLTTIRWIDTHPIVPGLGNLHGRLAFNQSFFTYAASLDVVANGSRMANGFLLLLALATFLTRRDLPSLFGLPVVIHLAWLSPMVASPTPDLASTLLQLVMFVMLLRGGDERAILVVLAATAITIKLSNLVFAAVIIAMCIRARRALVLAGIVLVVWMARGYVLSGAPLYPSTFGYVAFDWSIPRGEVAAMAEVIRNFARNQHNVIEKATVIAPLLLGTILIVAARRRGKELLILLPVIAGLAFWYFTAPDPRFAHALFFCFAIGGAVLFLDGRSKVAVLIVFALINLGLLVQIVRHRPVIAVGWQPIPNVPLTRRVTASGLVVNVPAEGEKCWDAPLPCAAHFRDDLTRYGQRGFAISASPRRTPAESSASAPGRGGAPAP